MLKVLYQKKDQRHKLDTDLNQEPGYSPVANQQPPKFFAQALAGSRDKICNIPPNQLPRPCIKGDELAISIPKDEYVAGLEGCKTPTR